MAPLCSEIGNLCKDNGNEYENATKPKVWLISSVLVQHVRLDEVFFLFFLETMTSSYKLALLLIISCVLLSMFSQNVEGQLPGIRWGRGFQEGEGLQKESKGKHWRLLKKRLHELQLAGKASYISKFILPHALILCGLYRHSNKR